MGGGRRGARKKTGAESGPRLRPGRFRRRGGEDALLARRVGPAPDRESGALIGWQPRKRARLGSVGVAWHEEELRDVDISKAVVAVKRAA